MRRDRSVRPKNEKSKVCGEPPESVSTTTANPHESRFSEGHQEGVAGSISGRLEIG